LRHIFGHKLGFAFKRSALAPTCLQRKPFDEKVERLSLFGDQSYVAHLPVQTDRIEDLATSRGV
ncbi:MAG: hypothetical protein ACK45A_17005, partial [Planctomyces sp.]